MKENKLTVQIHKSIEEVFDFTTNPANTHKWIDSITEEHIDMPEVVVGTMYTNTDRDGKTNRYVVSEYEEGKQFQLDSIDSPYKVKYTYRAALLGGTELEYLEWVTEGELENPFAQATLDKLKEVMEA